MSGTASQQIAAIAAADYNGVESACEEIADPAGFKALLEEHKLDYIPLIYTEGDHYASFECLIDLAATYAPQKIVAHAGRDVMSFREQVQFFTHALKIEQAYGIPIAHETHRRRPLFSPMNTLALLAELPELKLNIDLSHWCCVTESMLEDHGEAVHRALAQSIHLHARVGYENGPQVPDPRVREWEAHQGRFEVWWKEYVSTQLRSGASVCTVTPEYGPPSYMHTLPATGLPAADLWEVCLWSAIRFREMYRTIV